MRALLAALALSFVVVTAAGAQRGKVPDRPALTAGADTNSALAYYALGLEQLVRNPERAAAAFHWATRLDPMSADAFHGHRVALLMVKRNQLVRYMSGHRATVRHKDVQHADSLYLRALTLNPFFYQKLDGQLFAAYIRQLAEEMAGTSGNAGQLQFEIERYLSQAPAATRAWRAYADGDFDSALRQYATAIKSARYKAGLRVERGRIFFQLNRPDSALAELTLAVEEMRKRDDKDLVFVYESKALTEHSLGLVHNRLGNADAAREAFGRALQEDLAFAPAHVQLGFLALEAKDTVTAVSELDLAVQIAEDDEALRYQYGFTLHELGRATEAEAQLRRAIALNPVYAGPHLVLGQALAAQGRAAEATDAVRAFLALAARADTRRAEAEQLLATLAGAGQ